LGTKAETPRYRFEALDKGRHERAVFSCGQEALDNYLKQQAGQDVEKRVAAVFVATDDGKTISGYFALSQYSIQAGELPAATLKQLKLPKYPALPATLIGRLARATTHKGRGLGELLLMSALERALAASREIGSIAVAVDAKDEEAINFYASYGFIRLPEHPNRLFLPMATVEMMFR